MVIRMRHTRAHTANRRSHHALTAPALSTCANCGAKHRPHHMCLDCGFYKGKMVMDMSAKKKSREERMQAKKDAIKAQNGSVETQSSESIPEEAAEVPLEKMGTENSKVVDSPEMAQPKTSTPRKGQAS